MKYKPLPLGVPSDGELYLTVYPLSCQYSVLTAYIETVLPVYIDGLYHGIFTVSIYYIKYIIIMIIIKYIILNSELQTCNLSQTLQGYDF